MRVSASGTARVKGLQGPETMLGAGSLETRTALTSLSFDELKLAVERVDFGRDIEDAGVGLMVAGDLCGQPPVIGAAGQFNGLMVRRRLATDGVDEPHWKRLSGGVADIGGGGV